jgi:hypothetical protein
MKNFNDEFEFEELEIKDKDLFDFFEKRWNTKKIEQILAEYWY